MSERDGCPSPEQIAGGLEGDAYAAWLDHAASCAQCRAVVLVTSSPTPIESTATEVAVGRPRIGRYAIDREIGRGAMGVVYAAEDLELGRRLAIKVLHDTHAPERLRREARVLARLDHRNVVRIYDVGEAADRAFVVMELIDGENLRSWLTSPRNFLDILAVLIEAGRGLEAAHAAAVIHRDFKPDNVLVTVSRDGSATPRVVVGDFGLSRFDVAPANLDTVEEVARLTPSDHLTVTGAAIGTPAYMAPEQLQGVATAASDQFAYCVTAWEACFGVRPFAGTSLGELHARARAGALVRPSDRAVPRRVERALRRGLAAQPADRYPTMTALIAALAPRRRHVWWLAGGAAALLCAFVLAWVWRSVHAVADTPCAQVATSLQTVWDTAARARIADRSGPAVVAEIDRYAAAWIAARVAVCHEPATSEPSEIERRSARDGCLDRARVELTKQIAAGGSLTSVRAGLLPLAACDGVATSELQGAVDALGCGCPYSACVDRVCLSECDARAFRVTAPIAGLSQRGRQEAVVGASRDGSTVMYLAGTGCSLDRVWLAHPGVPEWTSIDITDPLVARGIAIREGCCTLADDGRAIVGARADRSGFVSIALDGDRLGAVDSRTFATLAAPLIDGKRPQFANPVVAPDQRTIYFTIGRPDGQPADGAGIYEAVRPDPTASFGPARRVRGRAANYEYVTGLSDDELTMFMASEYATRVLFRRSRDQPYGHPDVSLPPRLVGWRAIPLDHCRRVITTTSPGGCASEDIVFLEAITRAGPAAAGFH